jgi:hypothetical protein
VSWPPKVGEPLPRAAEAWCVEAKWTDWVLAERGHAQEWSRVFHVDPADRERVWEAIATASLTASIETARETPGGIICGVLAEIAIGERTARVMFVCDYASEHATPRLVTAYPAL